MVMHSEPVGSTTRLRGMQRRRPGLFRYLLRSAAGSSGQATQVCDPVRMPCGGASRPAALAVCPCPVLVPNLEPCTLHPAPCTLNSRLSPLSSLSTLNPKP